MYTVNLYSICVGISLHFMSFLIKTISFTHKTFVHCISFWSILHGSWSLYLLIYEIVKPILYSNLTVIKGKTKPIFIFLIEKRELHFHLIFFYLRNCVLDLNKRALMRKWTNGSFKTKTLYYYNILHCNFPEFGLVYLHS